MDLVLEAVAAELDSTDHIVSRLHEHSKLAEMALRLDGTEIDGASFSMEAAGDAITIIMKGENVSDAIKANYPALSRSPVMQISFKSPEARFTANTLNKLMRHANKQFPGRALLIREVKSLSYE